MNKYKTINIIATIIGIAGIGYQLYSDAYVKNGNDYGTLIVIAALGISTINQFAKSRNAKEE